MILQKAWQVFRHQGLRVLLEKARFQLSQRQQTRQPQLKDVLFINGVPRQALIQAVTYRVDHQVEQLRLAGLSVDVIEANHWQESDVLLYQAFVIYRAEKINLDLIKLAQRLGKPVYYDIDDLVFDTKYTQHIQVDQVERYNQGVINMGTILKACDCAITTTPALKKELESFIPTLINPNVASLAMLEWASQSSPNTDSFVHIGYFSGSSTHQPDFDLISGALETILNRYPQVHLHLVGHLKQWQHPQVIYHDFMSYEALFQLLAQMDINLCPLVDNLFNEAKSSIKWQEAALVKTVSIASDLGHFHEQIKHLKTGLLVQNDQWEQALSFLIEQADQRHQLAENAYEYVTKQMTTLSQASLFAKEVFAPIKGRIGFVIPKVDVSGGMMVILEHAKALKAAGYQVVLLNLYEQTDIIDDLVVLPVSVCHQPLDLVIKTMWTTTSVMVPARKTIYLVQNQEYGFYSYQDDKWVAAYASYQKKDYAYFTVSRWCQNWLKEYFNQSATYLPNGIWLDRYTPRQRDLSGQIHVLIEGDSLSQHKNVDEAFHIVDELDERFVIHYMSYKGKGKAWYRIDKFHHQIPFEKVGEIYRQCDLLIKTSLLESFSYPPLEMMATGGYVFALQNDGNQEYLNETNAILLETNQPQANAQKILKLVNDQKQQEKLYQNGLKTAQSRDWNHLYPEIVQAYQEVIKP